MRVPVLAGGVVLAVAALAAAAGPVATCAGARPRSIEALVCGSPLLTALDAETARLYRLATGPREAVVAIGARQAQRDWLRERNHCVKTAARETCIRDSTWRASRGSASPAAPPARTTAASAGGPSRSGARTPTDC